MDLLINLYYLCSQCKLFSPSFVLACVRPTFELWSITASIDRQTIPLYEKWHRFGQYFRRRLLKTSMFPVRQQSLLLFHRITKEFHIINL